MPRRPIRIAAVLLAIAVAACSSPTLADGVSLETYVETMAALRRVQDDLTRTPALKQQARDSVLRAHNVTAEQLEAAAAALANDPTRAFATWQAIERRVTAADSAGRPR